MPVARMHLNESPFEPSKLVASYVSRYASLLNLYQVEELEAEFMKRLSSYVGLPEDHLRFFPSSSEALATVIRYCRSKGLRLVSVWPTFHGFRELAQMEGVRVDQVDLTPGSFELDLARLAREGGSGRALYLCNPNNPTSNMLFEDRVTLDFLLDRFRLVVVDEAYFEFSRFTVADRVRDSDGLLVVRTFSKAFSLAGARVGYVAANPELAAELGDYAMLFSVPITSLAAALGALEDLDYMEEVVERTLELREELRRGVSELGLHSLDSRTNFLFIKTPAPGGVLTRRLREAGLRVRAYDDDAIRNYIRVSVSTRENNLRFLGALAEILRTL